MKKGQRLTARQQAVLDAIQGWIRDYGYPPTIRELGQSLGIRSLRGVTTHLDAIAKKGFITRAPRARSIKLTDSLKPLENLLRIPIVGSIRAGQPALAEENIEGEVVVDSTWVSRGADPTAGNHFALRVKGDSMMNAGILQGDYVIVRQQESVQNGDIVVARLEDEATVKRFFREADGVRLQPENPAHESIRVSADRPIAILGKVVAVFRSVN